MPWQTLQTFTLSKDWQFSALTDGTLFRLKHTLTTNSGLFTGLICQRFADSNASDLFDIRKVYAKTERDLIELLIPEFLSGRSIGIRRTDRYVNAWTIELQVLTEAVISLPPGLITQYAGSAIPSGWLLCDGSTVSRTTYAALFLAIGTTYGAADGVNNFNLPDLRGRTLIGAGQGSGGLTNRVRGVSGGTETHQLTTAEMPAHGHRLNVSGTAGMAAFSHIRVDVASGLSTNYNTALSGGANYVENTGGGGNHNNMQPFSVVHHMIKT